MTHSPDSFQTPEEYATAREERENRLKVVPLHDGRPLINDIPNRLRLLADLIENGEQHADYAIVIIDGDRPIPDVYGYGDALNTREILGFLDLTKDWFIRQVVVADAEQPEE